MSTDKNQPDINDYEDWRQFLRDVVDWKKKTDTTFSLRQFARKAELSTHTHLTKVLEGKVELNNETMLQYARAFEFDQQTTTRLREKCFSYNYEAVFEKSNPELSLSVEIVVGALSNVIGRDSERIARALQNVISEQDVAFALSRLNDKVEMGKQLTPVSEGEQLEMARSALRLMLQLVDKSEVKTQGNAVGFWATPEQIKHLHQTIHNEVHKTSRSKSDQWDQKTFHFFTAQTGTFPRSDDLKLPEENSDES